MAILTTMAMRAMKSGIGTNPARLTSQIGELKARQDNATARMGSDMVGAIGTADPDFYGFVTAPFKEMKPVTVQSGSGIYSTLAILPDQHHATQEDRYYSPSTPFAIDRAGGSAVVGLNVLRSGPPPAGYYGGQKLMVRKRVKQYFKPDPGDGSFCFIWQIAGVEAQPEGYALQADEQLDGDFYPGSIYLGIDRPSGWTFPTDGNGRMLYNQDPFTEAGWSGASASVPDNAATKPRIDSVSPNTYTIGGPTFTIDIVGLNFTDCGFVLIGPFHPVPTLVPTRPPEVITSDIPANDAFMVISPDGAYPYRWVESDTLLHIDMPTNDVQPGVFNVLVIGNDGQLGVAENAFTILGGP